MFLKTEFKKYLNSKGLKPVSVLKYSEQVPAFFEKISGKSLYNYHNIADLVPAISKIKKILPLSIPIKKEIICILRE